MKMKIYGFHEWRKTVVLILASVTISFGIGEWATRNWIKPFSNREEERFMIADSDLGWVNRPDFSSVFTNWQRGYHGHVTFDSLGLRSNGSPSLVNPDLTILAIGDSTTAGLEVDDDRTYSAVLESKLRALGYRVNVINAGVRGYGTDQSYLRLRHLIPIIHPNLVLYLSCGNDFTDNLVIKNWYRSYSKPVFILSNDRLSIANSPTQPFAQGVYAQVHYEGHKYSFDSGVVKMAGWTGWLRDHSTLFDFLETVYQLNLHKQVINVVSRNEAVENEIFVKLLFEIKSVSPAFYVSGFTSARADNGYERVRALAQDNGFSFLDTQSQFQSGVRYGYGADAHWNESGHAQEADAIIRELTSRGELKRFQK